mmetsp:Transcript_2985/g.5625  ORF Transcript_2985/g.5625 Transcript_2985/m.5625 type:complete len:680 (+) Transcript_2985:390-2429(+)
MSTAGTSKSCFLPELIICENKENRGDDCGSETQSSTTQSSDEGEGVEGGQGDDNMKHRKKRQAAASGKAARSSSGARGRSPGLPKTSRSQTATKVAENRNEAELEITHSLTDLSLGNIDRHQMIAPVVTSSTEYSSEDAPATHLPTPTKSSRHPHHPHHHHHLIEEKDILPSRHVGRIIGKGGETIRDIQARSACHIDVNQDVEPGAPKIITYRGKHQEDIDLAKRLVHILCNEDSTKSASRSSGSYTSSNLPLGRATLKQIHIPQSIIGRIIGRGGEMIRELQSRSQARIQVDHSSETEEVVVAAAANTDTSHDVISGTKGEGAAVANSNEEEGPDSRLVTITGTKESVQKAEDMLMYLVTHPRLDGHSALREKDWSGSSRSFSGSVGDSRGNVCREGSSDGQVSHQGQMPSPAESIASTPTSGGPYWVGEGYAEYHGGSYDSSQQHQMIPPQPWNTMVQYPTSPTNTPPPYTPPPYTPVAMETDVLYCAKSDIGHIIGRKGATINDVQRRSQCSIQIHQEDCRIEITGPRMGIQTAEQMIHAIMERGSNHPYLGGGRHHFERQHHGEPMSPRQQHPHPQLFGYADQAPRQQGYPTQPPPYGIMPQQQSYYLEPPPPPMYQAQQPLPQLPPQHQPYPAASQDSGCASSPWRMATLMDGQIYYYNLETFETSWDKPAGM